jgi:hypothetical protein
MVDANSCTFPNSQVVPLLDATGVGGTGLNETETSAGAEVHPESVTTT